jgi:4-hydroxy-tetrahydrodipicolinate synthase
MTDHRTRGVIAAALTPVGDDDIVCVDLLANHCLRLFAQGCDGVLLFGTTGEANSFSLDERRSTVEGVVAAGVAASRLIVGSGCCAIADTVALTRHALSLGIDRVLVLPPFYYKNVTDQGVIEAYSRAIQAIDDERLRLYLYRIPQLSSVDISPSIVEALIDRHPAVIAGIKDSSGDWDSIAELCSRFGARLDVLVGNERFLRRALAAGASGCVTATANAYAGLICNAYEKRDEDAGAVFQGKASAARTVFEQYPMIAALKAYVAHSSRDDRWRRVRPPITPLPRAHEDALLAGLSAALA